MKDLLLLARTASNYNCSFGGVVVSSRILNNYLSLNYNKTFTLVDSFTSYNYLLSIVVFVKTIIYIMIHKKVFLNLNEKEIIIYGIPFVLFSKILRKFVVIRFFGGNLDLLYNKNLLYKYSINFLIKNCNKALLQTNYLCKYFNNYKNILHFPTCRPSINIKSSNRSSNKILKIVYLGHIARSKGIDMILEASGRLISNIEFSLYGKLVDYNTNQLIRQNVSYCGEIAHHEIYNLLHKFDMLCFPSVHIGEGYPGVIIESFIAGIPVISSDWRALPELVIPNSTGVLFKANNLNDFIDKLKTLPTDPRSFYKKGVKRAANVLDSNKVYSDLFENHIK